MVPFSHPYMTTGKIIALNRQTFVSKLTSLLFNTLSRLVRAFLPRSKHLLISWLRSPSTAFLEPKKIKSFTVFIVFPSLPWSNGTRCHDLSFFVFLFFNWRIIALQNFVVFCHTSTRISHRYTHVPSLLDLHPILPNPTFSLSQSPYLSSLSHTANSHWLSLLHMVM